MSSVVVSVGADMMDSVVMVVVGVDADATWWADSEFVWVEEMCDFGVRKCRFLTLKFNCHGFSARIKQKTRNTRQNQTYQVKVEKTRKQVNPLCTQRNTCNLRRKYSLWGRESVAWRS